jgi:hypothetical protein
VSKVSADAVEAQARLVNCPRHLPQMRGCQYDGTPCQCRLAVEASSWTLTPEQSVAFVETLLNPLEPSEKLKEAARRSREMFGENATND